jgi:hypothetical protein
MLNTELVLQPQPVPRSEQCLNYNKTGNVSTNVKLRGVFLTAVAVVKD